MLRNIYNMRNIYNREIYMWNIIINLIDVGYVMYLLAIYVDFQIHIKLSLMCNAWFLHLKLN
jgi:hypothetical protein